MFLYASVVKEYSPASEGINWSQVLIYLFSVNIREATQAALAFLINLNEMSHEEVEVFLFNGVIERAIINSDRMDTELTQMLLSLVLSLSETNPRNLKILLTMSSLLQLIHQIFRANSSTLCVMIFKLLVASIQLNSNRISLMLY